MISVGGDGSASTVAVHLVFTVGCGNWQESLLSPPSTLPWVAGWPASLSREFSTYHLILDDPGHTKNT